MLSDALAFLKDHLVKESRPEPIYIQQSLDRKTFIMPDGTPRVVEASPNPLYLIADTIAGFVDLAKQHKVVQVKFLDGKVDAFIDREGRERISLKTPLSQEWEAFIGLLNAGMSAEGITTKEMTRQLRCDMRKLFNADDRAKMIRQFGSLKIASMEGGGRTSSRSQDTMGVDIDRQVSPDIELPEDIILFRPVVYGAFDTRDRRYPVEVYVEPDLDRRTWKLRPMPDSLARAQQDARVELHALIQDALGDDIRVDH